MFTKRANHILIVAGFSSLIFAVLFLLLIRDLPTQPMYSYIVGLFLFGTLVCLSLIALQYVMGLLKPKDDGEDIHLPDGHVAVIYQNKRRLSTSDEPKIKIYSKKGQRVELVDLRQRFIPFEHIVETRDNAQLRIKGTITWQISSVERYFDYISTTNEDHKTDEVSLIAKGVIESTIKSILVRQFGQAKYRDLIDSLSTISLETLRAAYGDLRFFGVFTSKLQIVSFELTTGDAAREEVERLRALNLAVKEMEARTLDHVEKLANTNNPELKLHIDNSHQ